MVKMMTGWTTNRRPFTRTEFNNSYLKKNGLVKHYADYLESLAYLEKKKSRKRVKK